VIAILGWEYRVWKRKLYYGRNRDHFPGSTPFYGKMWGYESDYMIETSLDDGDLIFWAADPLAVHINEAIFRFPYRHIKGDYDSWDFCGVVKKIDGQRFVLGPSGRRVLYSDLVADHRTTSLAIRKLVDTSNGEARANLIQNLPMNLSKTDQYVYVGWRGYLEYSLKSFLARFMHDTPDSWMSQFLLGSIRAEMRVFPWNIIGSVQRPFYEISDVFMAPLVQQDKAISYSPPFFVRRVDNEYYNHNRTKNIVVDWDLLMHRDQRNRIVSKHNDGNK
jgi:hypothetical protein